MAPRLTAALTLCFLDVSGAGLERLQAEAANGIVLELKTTGLLPGAGPEDKPSGVQQRITVDSTGTKLLYEETREGSTESRRVILRTDGPRPLIFELIGSDQYKEHEGDLNRVQEERDLTEENEILSANHLPRKAREEFYKENCWLKPDGSREVKVTRSKGSRLLGYDCERILVTENCRTIIEGEVASVPVVAGGCFQLYRRLGAFSDKVLQELEKIDGVLLKGKVTVVTALRPNQFEVEATRIAPLAVEAKVFELTGRKKVEESKEAACIVCRKPLDPAGKTVIKVPGTKGGFCGDVCLDRWTKEFFGPDGGGKPRAKAQPPAPAPQPAAKEAAEREQ